MQPASPFNVYATIVNRGSTREPLRSCSVAGSGKRDRKSALPSALLFQFLRGVIECGEELEPSLDSGVVVPHFAYASQSIVGCGFTERGALKVAAEAFESPDDDASLQIEKSPMPFQLERSSIRDEFYGAVRLLLFKSGSEPVDEASQYT